MRRENDGLGKMVERDLRSLGTEKEVVAGKQSSARSPSNIQP